MGPSRTSTAAGWRRARPALSFVLCAASALWPWVTRAQTGETTGRGITRGESAPSRGITVPVTVPLTVPSHSYLDELLVARDSVIRRWPIRTDDAPIRAWIQEPAVALDGWDASFPMMVTEALQVWSGIGLPVRFALVRDSAEAEVQIFWADRLEADDSGRTVWWSNPTGVITRARVSLSMHVSDGHPQTPRGLRAVALHELGHVLGLSHTHDAQNIMAPWVQVADLSPADRLTAQLLYQRPIGRVVTPVSTVP